MGLQSNTRIYAKTGSLRKRESRSRGEVYLVSKLESSGEVLPPAVAVFSKIQSFAVVHRYDDISEIAVLDRAETLETVRVLR